MTTPRAAGDGYTVEEYFRLAELGLIDPDENVELLQGLIVSMAPPQPLHASVASLVSGLLTRALGDRAIVRTQFPLLAGGNSVPEPDVAVVPERRDQYRLRHPDRALLVVEVADSSLGQDRLTKSRIYAGAGVPDYWLVNLRHDCMEWFRSPDRERRLYREQGVAQDDAQLPFGAYPDVALRARDLFPPV